MPKFPKKALVAFKTATKVLFVLFIFVAWFILWAGNSHEPLVWTVPTGLGVAALFAYIFWKGSTAGVSAVRRRRQAVEQSGLRQQQRPGADDRRRALVPLVRVGPAVGLVRG